jgi:hypothetical protein
MRQFVLCVAFAAGIALVVWGFSTEGSDGLLWLVWVAAGVALMAGVVISVRRRGRQMREDLLAGKDVVARWQLSSSDIAAFQPIEAERVAADKYSRNWLSIPGEAPIGGVPIVLGRRTWLIGNRLYPMGASYFGLLANVAMFEGDPGYIEVAVLGQKSGPGYLLLLLRLPVPAQARTVACAAAVDLDQSVPPSNRKLRQRWFPDYASSVGG